MPKAILEFAQVSKSGSLVTSGGGNSRTPTLMENTKMKNRRFFSALFVGLALTLAALGAGSTRIFFISAGSTVTITDVTIRDGGTFNNGAGIFNLGNLRLKDVSLINNWAWASGGGISSSGDLSLENVSLVNNRANENGGGVYVHSGSARMTATQILSNTAGDDGGGVYVYADSATLSVERGTIQHNNANDGSGVYVSLGDATL